MFWRLQNCEKLKIGNFGIFGYTFGLDNNNLATRHISRTKKKMVLDIHPKKICAKFHRFSMSGLARRT